MECQANWSFDGDCIDPALLIMPAPDDANFAHKTREQPALHVNVSGADVSSKQKSEKIDFEESILDSEECSLEDSNSQHYERSDSGSSPEGAYRPLHSTKESWLGPEFMSPIRLFTPPSTSSWDHTSIFMQMPSAAGLAFNMDTKGRFYSSPLAPEHRQAPHPEKPGQTQDRSPPGRKKKKPEELLRHKRKVSKPEKCDQCGKGHADERDLNRHIVSNHRDHASWIGLDVSKIKCPFCDFQTDKIRNDRLTRHVKNIHNYRL